MQTRCPALLSCKYSPLVPLDKRAASRLLITQSVKYKVNEARLMDFLGSLLNETDKSEASASISVDWAHPPPRLTPMMAALN